VAFCFPLDKLAQDFYDVVACYLAFLLLPQWCFVLPLYGGAKGHKEMRVQFKRFLARGVFLWAQALVASSSLMFFPQHDPSGHKRLFYILVFGHKKEYFSITHILAPFSLTPTSFETPL
jgi:hypothetical protein